HVDRRTGQGAAAGTHQLSRAEGGVRRGRPGESPAPGRPARRADRGDAMTPVILVVEDNERNLKLLRDVLTYAGYDVRAARTAEDRLSLALDDPLDLVLMDIELPGMDGAEALVRLRESPRTAGVPVVAVTALAMK